LQANPGVLCPGTSGRPAGRGCCPRWGPLAASEPDPDRDPCPLPARPPQKNHAPPTSSSSSTISTCRPTAIPGCSRLRPVAAARWFPAGVSDVRRRVGPTRRSV